MLVSSTTQNVDHICGPCFAWILGRREILSLKILRFLKSLKVQLQKSNRILINFPDYKFPNWLIFETDRNAIFTIQCISFVGHETYDRSLEKPFCCQHYYADANEFIYYLLLIHRSCRLQSCFLIAGEAWIFVKRKLDSWLELCRRQLPVLEVCEKFALSFILKRWLALRFSLLRFLMIQQRCVALM